MFKDLNLIKLYLQAQLPGSHDKTGVQFAPIPRYQKRFYSFIETFDSIQPW